jgi:hypothetical protein
MALSAAARVESAALLRDTSQDEPSLAVATRGKERVDRSTGALPSGQLMLADRQTCGRQSAVTYAVAMRRTPIIVARHHLHDARVAPRDADETAADRIAIVTALVRAHHGWDDHVDRPDLERVVQVKPLR